MYKFVIRNYQNWHDRAKNFVSKTLILNFMVAPKMENR